MNEAPTTVSFPQEVKAVFTHLLDAYAFKCASSTPLKVRYESKSVFIEIVYGPYDCEVAIEFGRLKTDEKLSFTLFLQSVNPALEKQMGDRIAFEPDKVRSDLAALARALEAEGQQILKAENSVFEQSKALRWWHFQPDALKKKTPRLPSKSVDHFREGG
jgi:hypothetical protein